MGLDSSLGLEGVDDFFEDDEDKRLIFTLEEEEVLDLSAMSVSELFDESKFGFVTFEAGPDFTLEAGPGLDDDLGPGLDDFVPKKDIVL